MQNRISITLTEGERLEAIAAIDTLDALLPFLVALDSQDRLELPKMGDKSLAFVRRSVTMAQDGADYLPRSFDITEFANDLANYDRLLPVLQKLGKLQQRLEDTMMLLGSDLYVGALEHYAAAKRSGRAQGLDDLVALLGRRFSRKSSGATGSPGPSDPSA